ncbi:unnamed protein product [Effrenium voratum]|nr:unnamed protein product [Effrenium voratum]
MLDAMDGVDSESEGGDERVPLVYIDFDGFPDVEHLLMSLSAIHEAERGVQDSLRSARTRSPVAPRQMLTHADIHQMYAVHGAEHFAEMVNLVLKLSLAMMTFGQTAADTEDIILSVSSSIGLPVIHFQVGLNSLDASFHGGIVHKLGFSRGLDADKLAATISLASLIANKVGNVQGAVDLLDEIFSHRAPYGVVIQKASFYGLSVLAALAAFMGTSEDVLAVAIIMPAVMLVQSCCRRFCSELEAFAVALAVGGLTPAVARLLHLPLCDVPVIYLSPLLTYLPGSQLTYGAYEIQFGCLHNGVSQLGSCVVRCMFLSLALLLGWQFFGHRFYTGPTASAAAASMVPVNMSCMFPYSWEVVFLAWNVPLLLVALIGLNLPLKKMWAPMLIAYGSLLVYIVLLKHPAVAGGIPDRIIDCIALFIAANMACLYEYKTATPAVLAILPVLLILAPGSKVVLSVLASMQLGAKLSVQMEPVLDLMLQGVAYAAGLTLALHFWRPFLRRKARKRCQQHMY